MIRFVPREETSVADLLADLASAGQGDVVVGGRTKETAIARFAETLDFPAWFGGNLDALYETLDEHAFAATLDGTLWTLHWVPSRHLVREHARDYARIVSVLADVAQAHPHTGDEGRGVRRVVVHGPDPAEAPMETA